MTILSTYAQHKPYAFFWKGQDMKIHKELEVEKEKTNSIVSGKINCGGIGDVIYTQNLVPNGLEIKTVTI